MEKNIIEQAIKIYGLSSNRLEFLGGFNDNVFLSRDKNIVIKFLDAEKNTKENLFKEIEVAKWMKKHGISTPIPILSLNGDIIELIRGTKNDFYTISFQYIEGTKLFNFEEDNDLIKQWGRTLGKMHEISKKYADQLDKNYWEWNHDLKDEQFFKGTGLKIERKWTTYMEKLASMPTHQDIYGIVHHDLHNQNIMLVGKELYVLDFGDVRKSWFVYDATIPLYHALEKNRNRNEHDRIQFYERFKKYFFAGYREKCTLFDDQYEQIPFFLEYRLLYSYLYFINSFKSNEISTDVKKILDDMKFRIENDVRFIV